MFDWWSLSTRVADRVTEHRRWVAGRLPVSRRSERALTTVQTVVLTGCVVLAVVTIGLAIAEPTHGQPYTEFAVLTHDGDQFVADDYPSVESANGTVFVMVSNHERRRTDYTVVATAQRVGFEGNRTEPVVYERLELGQRRLSLAHNRTDYVRFDVTESPAGRQVRAVFRLYRGAPSNTPYRSLHIWVNGSAESR